MENIDNDIFKDYAKEDDVSLDEMRKSLGLTSANQESKIVFKPEEVAMIQDDPGVVQGGPGLQSPKTPAAPDMGGDVQNLTKGLAKGTGLAVQNIYNGAQDLINGVASLAQVHHGLPMGDVIPKSAKSNIQALQVGENASPEERAGAFIGQYAAPVVATMGVGAGVLASTAVGAGVDFMTLDPHQERLSSLLLEKYPDMKNVAILGNMMEWMAERDPSKESELEGRFKNALEGVGIGLPVAMAFKGIAKMTSNTKKYLNKAPDAANIVPAKAPLEEAELAAIEAKMGQNAVGDNQVLDVRPMNDAEKADFLKAQQTLDEEGVKKIAAESAAARVEVKEAPPIINPNAGYTGADGSLRTNVHSPFFDNILLLGDNASTGYVSRTFEDVRYQARLMGMSEDKDDILYKIVNRQAGDAPFSVEETAFIATELLPRFKVEHNAARLKWEATDPETMDFAFNHMEYMNAMQRQFQLAKIAKEAGSETGALLNVHKLYYEIGGAREAMRTMKVARTKGDVITMGEAKTMPAVVYQALRDAAFKSKLAEEFSQKAGGMAILKEKQAYLKNATQYIQGIPVDSTGKYIDDLTKVSPEDVKYINGLGVGEAEKTLKMMEQAANSNPPQKALRQISTFSKMMMLSRPSSATAAWLGNLMTTVTATTDNFTKGIVRSQAGMGARLSKRGFEVGVPNMTNVAVLNKGAAKAFAEANDFMDGMMLGIATQSRTVRDTWKFPERSSRYTKVEMRGGLLDPRDLGITPWSTMGKMLSKTGAVLDTGLGFGLKFIGTADTFFGDINETAKLFQGAKAKVRAEIDEAARAGQVLSPEDITRKTQDYMALPSVEEVEDAYAFSKRQVFAQDIKPVEGDFVANKVGAGVNYLTDSPTMQFFNPFLKTGYNILDYGLEHSVLAPMWRYTTSGKALLRGGEEGAMAAAKILNGTAVTSAMAYFAYKGLVTGAPPDNPRLRRALEESNKGWKPYSFRVGDNYVSYESLQPLATMMKLGTGAYMIGKHMDERDAAATMQLMGAVLADSFSPQQLAENAANIFDVINDLSRFKDNEYGAQKFVNDQAGKLFPGVLQTVKRYQDPYKRDANPVDEESQKTVMQGLENFYKSKIPGWSEDLSVQRNMWGDPLLEAEMFGPDIAMPLPMSDATKGSQVREVLEKFARYELGRPEPENLMKLNFAMPERSLKIGGVDVRLTNEEYERYVLYTAGYTPDDKAVPGKEKPYREPLKNVVERKAVQIYSLLKGKEVPPALYDSFMKEIKKTVTEYREVAREKMERDPEFGERLQKARAARMRKQNVGF